MKRRPASALFRASLCRFLVVLALDLQGVHELALCLGPTACVNDRRLSPDRTVASIAIRLQHSFVVFKESLGHLGRATPVICVENGRVAMAVARRTQLWERLVADLPGSFKT